MRGRIPKDEHPLHKAIRLRNKAIRSKSDSKVISNLESRVKEEAAKSLDALGGSTEWIDKLSKELNTRKIQK